MPEQERSIIVTCVLCLVLVGVNFFSQRALFTELNIFNAWPVLFILCVVIFTRIFRGHSTL